MNRNERTSNPAVHIIGGGLAGSEAAWQLAERGHDVLLYEQRPGVQTPAHRTGGLAELVCSNSLRSNDTGNASGLLKEELRRCGSLIMRKADEHSVPAGGALAVDRQRFSDAVTEAMEGHPLIRVRRERLEALPDERPLIVASGPLTDGALAQSIRSLCGRSYFHFFDAAAPVVAAESIDMDVAWWGSRYNRGEAAYINCPLDEDQYEALVAFLVNAKKHKPHIEGEERYFEGCMPVEEMARRGGKTLAFGPLKPVGLPDPRTGKEPHAVVQLRIDNRERTLFNLVGFQTSLTQSEQREMMKHIPGLERAEIMRYGVMHQNSYLDSPRLLRCDGALQSDPALFFAGQITGVEGYLESVASGLASAMGLHERMMRGAGTCFPATTAIGGLMHYISSAETERFQPMNVNWGLLPKPARRIRKKRERNEELGRRALEDLDAYLDGLREG